MPHVLDRRKLEASVCRDSFYDFVRRMWSSACGEKPIWNWHIEKLCEEVQTVAERLFKREPKLYDLVVNVPPGSTKSIIFSEMFPAWAWARDPRFRTICGSYSDKLALELAGKFNRIVTADKYLDLFPEVVLTKTAASQYETSKGGQRLATSTGGSTTGWHAHCWVIDDPLNPEEAVSEVERKAANRWITGTLMTRTVDPSMSTLILVQQRLHQEDCSGFLLGRKSGTPVRHICIPALESPLIRPRSYRKYYIGGLFDPVRFPKKVLDAKKEDLGDYNFAGQFEQSPIPMGGAMFKVDRLVLMDKPPMHIQSALRYWDKAGTTGANAGAYTAGVKWVTDIDARQWIEDVKRGHWEAAERERHIKETAEADGRNCRVVVEQEPGSGGKESAQATAKNLGRYRVYLDRPTGDKITRADLLASKVNAHLIYVWRDAPWLQAFMDELRYFPFAARKDQVDAAAAGYAVLVGRNKRIGLLFSARGRDNTRG